jgi:hypothetical protein
MTPLKYADGWGVPSPAEWYTVPWTVVFIRPFAKCWVPPRRRDDWHIMRLNPETWRPDWAAWEAIRQHVLDTSG